MAGVVLGDVPDRVQMIGQCPLDHVITAVVNCFLGQDLIYRRAPQIPPLQIPSLDQARTSPLEVQHDLVLILLIFANYRDTRMSSFHPRLCLLVVRR